MKCKDCKYKEILSYTTSYASRYTVLCTHPDWEYIHNYLRDNRINRLPGFICYTKKGTLELTTKTAPRWCPLKKEEQK